MQIVKIGHEVAGCVLKYGGNEKLEIRNTKRVTHNTLLLIKYFSAFICENLRPNLIFFSSSI